MSTHDEMSSAPFSLQSVVAVCNHAAVLETDTLDCSRPIASPLSGAIVDFVQTRSLGERVCEGMCLIVRECICTNGRKRSRR